MATFDYTSLESTAQTLIAQFGKSGTLRKAKAPLDVSNAPFDLAGAAQATHTVIFVDTEQSVMPRGDTTGRISARTLIMSTNTTTTPTSGDEVQIDSKWHSVLDVRAINPGGTTLLWEVDVSR